MANVLYQKLIITRLIVNIIMSIDRNVNMLKCKKKNIYKSLQK